MTSASRVLPNLLPATTTRKRAGLARTLTALVASQNLRVTCQRTYFGLQLPFIVLAAPSGPQLWQPPGLPRYPLADPQYERGSQTFHSVLRRPRGRISRVCPQPRPATGLWLTRGAG